MFVSCTAVVTYLFLVLLYEKHQGWYPVRSIIGEIPCVFDVMGITLEKVGLSFEPVYL